MSGLTRIGFYQTNLVDSVLLTGGKWVKREKELHPAKGRPDSGPVEELDRKSNQGPKKRKAQSAERRAVKAQGASLKAHGKNPAVSSQ